MVYSGLNLIDREMKANNFLERLMLLPNVHLTLMFPKDIFFRAKILCEDIYEYTEKKFYLEHLLEMLWTDFLDEVVKYQNVKSIYKLLLDYDRGTPNVRLTHYQERKVEEVPLYPIRRKTNEGIEEFYCRIKRKLVLRGEVMLQDIAQVYPNHHLTFERVLEILLIDFIVKYRKGEAKSIICEYVI